jgi:hydroxyacylglutathione hydrolase
MFFRQVKWRGDNFSYVIADPIKRDAAVVDSSYNVAELIRIFKVENFYLKYIFNTHGHSDHTAGNFELRSALGGQIIAHRLSREPVDVTVGDGDVLTVGSVAIKVIFTPGHTADGVCLLVAGEKLLTGDTLFVGECGRVDLPGGSAERLYDSLFNKLLFLADEIEVYPGHDYGVKPVSTIGAERLSNYVLAPRSLAEFVEFMGTPKCI